MATTDKRLWYTADRERLVEDGDEAAAILAYRAGEEVSPADEGKLTPAETSSSEKQAKPAANKARTTAANKKA